MKKLVAIFMVVKVLFQMWVMSARARHTVAKVRHPQIKKVPVHQPGYYLEQHDALLAKIGLAIAVLSMLCAVVMAVGLYLAPERYNMQAVLVHIGITSATAIGSLVLLHTYGSGQLTKDKSQFA